MRQLWEHRAGMGAFVGVLAGGLLEGFPDLVAKAVKFRAAARKHGSRLCRFLGLLYGFEAGLVLFRKRWLAALTEFGQSLPHGRELGLAAFKLGYFHIWVSSYKLGQGCTPFFFLRASLCFVDELFGFGARLARQDCRHPIRFAMLLRYVAHGYGLG